MTTEVERLRAYKKFADVLAAQVLAVISLVEGGGDLRTAKLNDRPMLDRLRDTIEAMAQLGGQR